MIMKKNYTKKQIAEAISYWKKQLKMMNEDANVKFSNPKEYTFQNIVDAINSVAFHIYNGIDDQADITLLDDGQAKYFQSDVDRLLNIARVLEEMIGK